MVNNHLRPEVEDIGGALLYESQDFIVVGYGEPLRYDYDIVKKSEGRITHCWGWQAVVLRQAQLRWFVNPPTAQEVDEFLDNISWLGAIPFRTDQ